MLLKLYLKYQKNSNRLFLIKFEKLYFGPILAQKRQKQDFSPKNHLG